MSDELGIITEFIAPDRDLSPNPSPLLIVLSGPSGVGKDAVLSRMRELRFPHYYCVTATTRPRRSCEVDGVDYYFLKMEEFQHRLEHNEFLEYARVYGNYYGVPKQPVRDALRRGEDVVIKADVQGAATIKSLVPDAVFIFLSPPNMGELEERLRQRKTESPEGLARRLRTAHLEMKYLPMFDYLVVNPSRRLDDAVDRIQAIIAAEKCRVHPRHIYVD